MEGICEWSIPFEAQMCIIRKLVSCPEMSSLYTTDPVLLEIRAPQVIVRSMMVSDRRPSLVREVSSAPWVQWRHCLVRLVPMGLLQGWQMCPSVSSARKTRLVLRRAAHTASRARRALDPHLDRHPAHASGHIVIIRLELAFVCAARGMNSLTSSSVPASPLKIPRSIASQRYFADALEVKSGMQMAIVLISKRQTCAAAPIAQQHTLTPRVMRGMRALIACRALRDTASAQRSLI